MPEPAAERAAGPRGHLGRVLGAGLVTAGLAAVASTRSWVSLGDAAPDPSGPGGSMLGSSSAGLSDPTTYPLASAVALVLLASWGVLLVTRGRVRRAFAVLATVAAVGLVATVLTAGLTLRESAERSAAGSLAAADGVAEAAFTGWFWVAAVVGPVAVVPAALAVLWAPRWPEMGSRYDAPAAAAERTAAAQAHLESDLERDPAAVDGAAERDLWRSLDEGLDPTDPTDPHAGGRTDRTRGDQAP